MEVFVAFWNFHADLRCFLGASYGVCRSKNGTRLRSAQMRRPLALPSVSFVLSAVNQIINPVISAEAAAASATTIRGQLKYASITATAVPTAAVILLPVE